MDAQTIYPISRAEILAGAKFDFKVEFDGAPAADDLKVAINGRDAAQVLGKSAIVDAKEEGQDHTAYWIRGVSLAHPGTYQVTASAGGKTQSVTWEVYGTPARKARNVILFVGDGLSVAHRTAARMLVEGDRRRARDTRRARHGRRCRTWRWWARRAPTRS